MDAPSTRRVAHALGLWYVYYPAIFSLTTQRDSGMRCSRGGRSSRTKRLCCHTCRATLARSGRPQPRQYEPAPRTFAFTPLISARFSTSGALRAAIS
jgi:hypothetical protein